MSVPCHWMSLEVSLFVMPMIKMVDKPLCDGI